MNDATGSSGNKYTRHTSRTSLDTHSSKNPATINSGRAPIHPTTTSTSTPGTHLELEGRPSDTRTTNKKYSEEPTESNERDRAVQEYDFLNFDTLTPLDQDNNNDDLQSFSLDMVSADMDFEQAYSTYTSLQQKQALSAVEHLKKVQMLNQQYDSAFGGPMMFPGNSNYEFPSDIYSFPNTAPDFTSNPQTHGQQVLSHGQAGAAGAAGQSTQTSNDGGMGIPDDFDHFFSSTESNALEKFLDNLANPQPLTNQQTEFYTYQPSQSSSVLTQSPSQQFKDEPQDTPQDVKHELSEAFSHPPSLRRSVVSATSSPSLVSPPKRAFEYDDQTPQQQHGIHRFNQSSSPEETPRKRKRSTTKQLLSLEQKRLNHLYLEQKRRQLCKLAYERCLRLIVDLDEYVSKNLGTKKSMKRKQKIKDGLPNVSKHTALVRLSEEIITIQTKNRELQKLLQI